SPAPAERGPAVVVRDHGQGTERAYRGRRVTVGAHSADAAEAAVTRLACGTDQRFAAAARSRYAAIPGRAGVAVVAGGALVRGDAARTDANVARLPRGAGVSIVAGRSIRRRAGGRVARAAEAWLDAT